MMTIPVLCYFDVGTADLEKTDLHDKKKKVREDGKGLVCRVCNHRITHEKDIVEINGSHIHTFMNPAGYEYTFGCYQQAPGCTVFGRPSFEYTWFADHSWQIATCLGCNKHLGWLFRNSEDFFGLIQNRLLRS